MKMFNIWRAVVCVSFSKDKAGWFTRRADGNQDYHTLAWMHTYRDGKHIRTFIIWRLMIKVGIV